MNADRIDITLSLKSHTESNTRASGQGDEDFIDATAQACSVANLTAATTTVDEVPVFVERGEMNDADFKAAIASAIKGAVGI